jgi:hypothetical protein
MRHYAKPPRATLTALLTLVAMAGAAVAGPLEDAVAADQCGDYATEYRLLRPLADQGNAAARSRPIRCVCEARAPKAGPP